VVWFSINQYWLWDALEGPLFRVTSYNGGGWDSDSSGSDWLYVDLDDVAMDTAGQFVPDLVIAAGDTGSTVSGELPSFRPLQLSTNSLGWLFWNELNGGVSTEIYEVLVPLDLD
jgi:hypothetical protein